MLVPLAVSEDLKQTDRIALYSIDQVMVINLFFYFKINFLGVDLMNFNLIIHFTLVFQLDIKKGGAQFFLKISSFHPLFVQTNQCKISFNRCFEAAFAIDNSWPAYARLKQKNMTGKMLSGLTVEDEKYRCRALEK